MPLPVAAFLMLVLMLVAVVQIVGHATFLSGDHPAIPVPRRRTMIASSCFFLFGGIGSFFLAGARFAELILA